MKIALRILIIIAITALIAGGIYLLVENTSITSGLESGQGQRGELVEGKRSGGDHDHGEGASLTRGLAQMSVSLVKIGAITAFALAIQFIVAHFKKRKTLTA